MQLQMPQGTSSLEGRLITETPQQPKGPGAQEEEETMPGGAGGLNTGQCSRPRGSSTRDGFQDCCEDHTRHLSDTGRWLAASRSFCIELHRGLQSQHREQMLGGGGRAAVNVQQDLRVAHLQSSKSEDIFQ